jgi:hypothetical protein
MQLLLRTSMKSINATNPEPFRLVFCSEIPGNSGQKSRTRSLDRLAEWSFLEPFRERPAGPKHTRAEQDQS